MSYLAGAAQIGGVMVGAPLVIGMTRQVRARWEGRAAPACCNRGVICSNSLASNRSHRRGRRSCSPPRR